MVNKLCICWSEKLWYYWYVMTPSVSKVHVCRLYLLLMIRRLARLHIYKVYSRCRVAQSGRGTVHCGWDRQPIHVIMTSETPFFSPHFGTNSAKKKGKCKVCFAYNAVRPLLPFEYSCAAALLMAWRSPSVSADCMVRCTVSISAARIGMHFSTIVRCLVPPVCIQDHVRRDCSPWRLNKAATGPPANHLLSEFLSVVSATLCHYVAVHSILFLYRRHLCCIFMSFVPYAFFVLEYCDSLWQRTGYINSFFVVFLSPTVKFGDSVSYCATVASFNVPEIRWSDRSMLHGGS
jgi:hypothetical protein